MKAVKRRAPAAETPRIKTAKIARYERQINELQTELVHMQQEMASLRRSLSATASGANALDR